jgi:hypothetical protein
MYKDVEYNPDPEINGDPENPEPEQGEDESNNDYDARMEVWYEWCEETRQVVLPEPPEKFEPWKNLNISA